MTRLWLSDRGSSVFDEDAILSRLLVLNGERTK